MKKIICGLFLFLPLIVKAAPSDIVITEIGAYKAADHEWIEIYNRGSASVDIIGWKFFEDETNHKLTAYRGDLIIEPGEFAIIADVASNFEIDYPNFKGTIIDSSWTILKEGGEPIALKDATGTILEAFTYIVVSSGSLERVDFNLPDYSSGNWQEKIGSDTAGFANTAPSSQSPVPITNNETVASTSATERPQANLAPAYSVGSVVINEFVSDPGDDAVEWIEILNKSEATINLSGWILEDALGKIAELKGEFLPQALLVFELTASRLNNNGDQIKLFDAKGMLIDSVSFGSFDDGKIFDNAPKTHFPNAVARGLSGLDTDEDSKNFFVSLAPTPGSSNNIAMTSAQDEEAIEEEAETASTVPDNDTDPKITGNQNIKPETTGSKNKPKGMIEIQGTVTVPPGVLGNQVFYIETSFGGREIYMFRKDFPKITLGDTLLIQGLESEAASGRRIKVKTKEDIIVLDKAKVFIPAREITIEDLTEDEVASLIKVSGEIIENKGKNKFILADDTGEFLVYMKPGANSADFTYVLGDKLTVTGILNQVSGAWRILPRWPSDLVNSSRVAQNPKPFTPSEPITLGKNHTLGIVFGSLGISGIGALFLGIKFKNRIFPRRRKHISQEEIVSLDRYE